MLVAKKIYHEWVGLVENQTDLRQSIHQKHSCNGWAVLIETKLEAKIVYISTYFSTYGI